LAMPTEEPEPRRLDEHRRAERRQLARTAAGSRASAPRARRRSAPAARGRGMTSLKTTLSMHSDEASTPAPDVGHVEQLEQPLDVPSSPNGPCSTGNARPRGRPSPGSRLRHLAVTGSSAGALDQDRHHLVPRGDRRRAHGPTARASETSSS
jgi:hypothetical protein